MRYEILDSNGAVTNTIEATEEFCARNFAFYRSAPIEVPPVVITENNISGLAYLRRFTQAQRIAIRDLAKTDAIAQDLMHLLDSTIAQGGQINLLDQDTINGVGYLAAMLPAQGIDPMVILA